MQKKHRLARSMFLSRPPPQVQDVDALKRLCCWRGGYRPVMWAVTTTTKAERLDEYAHALRIRLKEKDIGEIAEVYVSFEDDVVGSV